MQYPLSRAEIDLKALKYNFSQLKRFYSQASAAYKPKGVKKKYLLGVVKAQAYGHGMLEVAKTLQRSGVDFLGVSDATEGLDLRKNGIRIPILLFETTLPLQFKEIFKFRLIPTISDLSFAHKLSRFACKTGKVVKVHVSVDTGMNRLGIPFDNACEVICKISKLPGLQMEGLYTHFPVADKDTYFTLNQIKKIEGLVKQLEVLKITFKYIHAANSMGLVGYKTPLFNLGRPGLMLYGLYPHKNLKKKIKLKRVMSVCSRIVLVKKVNRDQGISYGHTYRAPRHMRIAILPIGYSDGYFRAFSNKAHVLIHGIRCPIVGRVTMDQTMVDVSRIKNLKSGAIVVIMGKAGKNEITADDLALIAKTISYEILCSLGSKLEHVYKK